MEIGAVLSKTEARQKNSRVKKFRIIAQRQSYGRFFLVSMATVEIVQSPPRHDGTAKPNLASD
jgi:hypothetical protein